MGKTTLAMKLAKDLDLLLLSKDDFKEMLYDTLGTPATREESRVYGLAAMKSLYSSAAVFLDAKKSVIIESAFTKGLAELDIEKLIANRDAKLLQVYITASPKTRLERYNHRIANGERHSGHPDAVGVVSEDYFAGDIEKCGRLAIDDTIEINTDVFNDANYSELLHKLKSRIGKQ